MRRWEVTVRLSRPQSRVVQSLRIYAIDPDEACSEGRGMAAVLWPGFLIEIAGLRALESLS